MPVQELAYAPRRGSVQVSAGDYTISGSDGSRIVNGSNGVHVVVGVWSGGSTSIGQGVCTYWGATSKPVIQEEEYDPEMVALLLRLDAEAPAAEFDNVIDMMDWLNRE